MRYNSRDVQTSVQTAREAYKVKGLYKHIHSSTVSIVHLRVILCLFSNFTSFIGHKAPRGLDLACFDANES